MAHQCGSPVRSPDALKEDCKLKMEIKRKRVESIIFRDTENNSQIVLRRSSVDTSCLVIEYCNFAGMVETYALLSANESFDFVDAVRNMLP